ncbi:FxsA family membrane protein [Streptomyces fragilis]|uniref:FxsA family membrane protein n=1 Tax=Streptomyces fragilis TaxID=67301 RepID=A0ABV2YEC9_9ACTN|nr:FxsA family membrane protein [Streptomyces fragilis]
MTTGPQRSFPPSSPGSSTQRPARRPRSRARAAVPLALAAWLVLEIWLLTLVADAAGGITVFALLAAGVVLGGAVVKRAGRRAFRSLDATLRGARGDGVPSDAGRRDPSRSEGNGLTMLGGILLIVPGLITDVAGLLLLVPPVQRAVRAALERTLERRLTRATAGMEGLLQQARIHRPDGKVVQGEVIREEPARDHGGPGSEDQGPRPPLVP